MTPAQWEQIQQHFDAALELDEAGRAAYLDSACADPRLRRQVSLMLLADAEASDDLERIMHSAAGESFSASLAAGTELGAYRIIEDIDHGGMGSVYLAERADRAFEQRVAIKVVNVALAGGQALSRFRSERQILARLEHPNIARLIDGGTTDAGAPYLVMEYIDGMPIDEYCNSRKLPTNQRLRLFADVCAAVNVAHQNLIVHRDIKPANILVTGEGIPKLLDFGIAKLIDPQYSGATLAMTQANMRLFTPEYASPEQVQGQPITTASDIYSLGVLLYRLLIGTSPYGADDGDRGALLAAICERAPLRPSTRVTTFSGEADRARLVARSTTAGRLRKRLRGDLDNIVLMALRKEPERRYESARRLAADIDNYLSDRPVTARQDTLAYRAGKYARRNAAAVGVGVAAVLAVVALVSFYTFELAAERDRARAAADEATQTAEFMQQLFRITDPNETKGQEVTARTLLDQGARQLSLSLDDQPRVRAALQTTIGKVYANLGILSDARTTLGAALATLEQQSGSSDPALVTVLNSLAEVAKEQDDFVAARRYAERALTLATASDDDNILPYESQLVVAVALEGEGLIRESQAVLETLRSDLEQAELQDTAIYARALTLLAERYAVDSNYETAAALSREALQRQLGLVGPLHGETIAAQRALAFILDRQRRFDESESLYLAALASSLTLYGDAHPDTALIQGELGRLYRHRNEPDKAMTYLEAALETTKNAYGEEHSFVAYDMVAVANLGVKLRGMAFAEPLFREALDMYERTLPADHPYKATAMVSFAHRLIGEGRSDEARPYLVRGKEICDAALPENHWLGAQFDILTGMALRREGNEAEATDLLRDGFDRLRAGRGVGHGATQNALKELLANLEATGQSAVYERYAMLLETPPGDAEP